MKILCLFVMSIISIASCGSVRVVNNKDFTYDELNRKLEGQKVTLEFRDGGKRKAYNVWVRDDSTYFNDTDVKSSATYFLGGIYEVESSSEEEILVKNIKIPTASLKQITNKKYIDGALKGLIYGTLGGATLGYLVGYTSYSGTETGLFAPNSAREAGKWGAAIVGITGGTVGLLLGGLNGDTDEFYFPQLEGEDTKFIQVKISSVVEEGSGNVIILWQGKEIKLLSSEYYQIGESTDGQMYIILPKEICLEKFK